MRLLSLLILLQCLFKAQTRSYPEIALKILDQYTEEIFDAAGNNSKCVEQLKIFLADLKSFDLWTLKMLDSWGKIEAGMLAGNLILLGNYDECLNIDVYSNGSRIQGQYCSATVRPTSTALECAQKKIVANNNTSGEETISEVSSYIYITWDVCIPAACSTNDLQKLWNFTENRYQVPFHLLFEDDRCSSIETMNTYTEIDIIAIITFCGIGIVVLLSTAYDVLIFQKRKVKEYNFFMAFSYYTNAKRLYSSSKRMQSTYITCLYGIRTISMMWIIVGHRYLFNIYGTSSNNFYFLEWLQHDGNMFIIGAIACVDTFFVISGFLIVYTIMLAKEMGLPIPVFVFWFHRFLRLTPGLIGMILVYIGISIHLGSGPFWYSTKEAFRQPCIDNWWSSILYIQNYMHPFSPCIAQSWYLSVDTQLYMLSPLLYFPLQRWPKLTIVVVLGLTGTSVGAAMYATFYYDISEFTLSVLTKYYEHLYNPTHIRMTPWFVGFLLGYLVIQTKDTKIVINKVFSLLLWVLSISLMLGILYGYVAFTKYTFPTLVVALFIGFSRVIWAMCISWIIFACTNGYGGYIDTFLSLPIFRILSRLTYSMYLTHFLLIFIVRGQAQTHSYIDNLLYFHEFWGDYAFTVGLSVIWTLTFESPVSILEAVLIRREFKKTEEHKATPTSDVLSSG